MRQSGHPHLFLAGLLAFVVALSVLAPSAAALTVESLRLGLNGTTTRVVIDVDQAVQAEAFALAKPYRLVVDLPEAQWQVPAAQGGQSKGLVERYRFGQFKPGTSRLVLDMAGPFKLVRFFPLPPQGTYGHRLVFDLAPVDRATFRAELQKRRRHARAPTLSVPTSNPAPRGDRRRVIVIDPGHGGVDPGTLSSTGVPEKQVVLDIAKTIKARLEQEGAYQVVLTRDSDIFLPLRERIAVARAAGADLFLSVHADALDNGRVRGATVYTLSESASDAEAAALARKENKSDLIAGIDLGNEAPEVTNILIDLAQRETMNFSARFAGFLIPELKRRHVVRTNSHRFAGFVVLKAPDVPSILLETGYLSNVQDARLLTSAKGRDALAESVTQAINRYFQTVAAADF
ncbi:MAG: N-acetylmuramoyl-L-alanine amidase [Rhodothalassiaceae bacterium]